MKKLLHKPLRQIEFAVVDLETTGFSSKYDSIIEVAAVKVKNGKIKEEFQSLIYTSFIPYYATRVHGIDIDMLQDAPCLNTVRNNFLKFIQNCVLVGHNIKAFDMPFLSDVFDISGDQFCVDTLMLSRMLFAHERTHKLTAVAQRLGIKSSRYHRALDDALVTANVFLKFLKLSEEDFKILKDIIA